MGKLVDIIIGFVVGLFSSLAASNVRDSAKGSSLNIWQTLRLRKTLACVPKKRNGYEAKWSVGEMNGEPAMHAHSYWSVTNVSDRPLQILKAYLVKPRTQGMVSTRHPEENVFGDYPILPDQLYPSEVHVMHSIQPQFSKEGESFKGKIVFIDQLNKKHKVKVKFESRSEKGTRILSVNARSSFQDVLNRNQLPKCINKQFVRNGHLQPPNLHISISPKGTVWEIEDTKQPSIVNTIKREGNKLNVYKPLIPRKRRKLWPSPKKKSAEGRMVASIQLQSQFLEQLRDNQLPDEMRQELERMGQLLPDKANISIHMKGTKWLIINPETPDLVYTAMLEEKRLNLYKRYKPPPRQAPYSATWTPG